VNLLFPQKTVQKTTISEIKTIRRKRHPRDFSLSASADSSLQEDLNHEEKQTADYDVQDEKSKEGTTLTSGSINEEANILPTLNSHSISNTPTENPVKIQKQGGFIVSDSVSVKANGGAKDQPNNIPGNSQQNIHPSPMIDSKPASNAFSPQVRGQIPPQHLNMQRQFQYQHMQPTEYRQQVEQQMQGLINQQKLLQIQLNEWQNQQQNFYQGQQNPNFLPSNQMPPNYHQHHAMQNQGGYNYQHAGQQNNGYLLRDQMLLP